MANWSDLEGHVAYFSMEFGLENGMNTYNGGLGILAGDVFRAFADVDAPAVGVTPLNDLGLGVQRIDDAGEQHYESAAWDHEAFMEELDATASLRLGEEEVTIGAWRYDVESDHGGTAPVIALDTNRPDNSEWARELTRRVYAAGLDRRGKVAQEVILGIGGVRILEELGYDVGTYHMNEGHASFLTLELLRRTDHDPEAVREQCVFTTHTPVAAAHEEFDYGLIEDLVGHVASLEFVREHTHPEVLHTTRLALAFSRYVNGVAKRHQQVSREMFPDYADDIEAVTNGVHVPEWVGQHLRELFAEEFPGYEADPYLLRHATFLDDEDLWAAHRAQKGELADFVRERTGVELDPDVLTICFARRAVPYKRATLLFRDVERLRHIARDVGDLQVIFSGKGFPGDPGGADLIRDVHRYIEELSDVMTMAYVPDYDMETGLKLTTGADVWLNNPRRPHEACGTSGMKAAINGVPHLSTLDGWWIEGHVEGETGWKIGPEPFDPGSRDLGEDEESRVDAESLYDTLENEIVPTYYDDRERWLDVMRNCIAFNGSYYHARRMIEQYLENIYA